MMLLRTFFFISALANTLSLTTAQTAADIGSVGVAGSSEETSSGSWTVTASGADIWGSSDRFHFLHFTKTNDCTLTLLVEGFVQNHFWSKGGLMIRDDLTPESSHASLFWTGGNYIAMQSRSTTSGTSSSHHSSFSPGKMWLRLVKEGDQLTGYYKPENDLTFTKFYTRTISFAAGDFYAGIAVTSHINTELATFTASNFEVLDEAFSLPSRDVGDVGREIEAQEVTAGKWSIKGAGSGIGGTSDHFAFMNYDHTGDITATVHIDSLDERNIDSKGGLMVRASHSSDAAHLSLVTTRRGGLTMIWRSSDGAETESKNVGVWQSDMDLKLVKTGNSVAAFYKHAGATDWFNIGSASVTLPSDFHVGLAVTSAEYGQHATLYAGDVTVV